MTALAFIFTLAAIGISETVYLIKKRRAREKPVLMKEAGFHVLRIGTEVTFLWIGLLILRDPAGWSGYIGEWIRPYLMLEPVQIMQIT